MRLGTLTAALILSAIVSLPLVAASQPTPAPYVTVYKDDAVTFQVRRDRISIQADGLYRVTLRWLFAQPVPWKTEEETSRVVLADLDCKGPRVRELGILHKNSAGRIIDSEEQSDAPWKSFKAGTGAHAATTRLCKFVQELTQAAKP